MNTCTCPDVQPVVACWHARVTDGMAPALDLTMCGNGTRMVGTGRDVNHVGAPRFGLSHVHLGHLSVGQSGVGLGEFGIEPVASPAHCLPANLVHLYRMSFHVPTSGRRCAASQRTGVVNTDADPAQACCAACARLHMLQSLV